MIKFNNIIKWIYATITALLFGVAVSMCVPANPVYVAGGIMAIHLAKMIASRFLVAEVTGMSYLSALVAYDPCNTTLGTYTQASDCLDEGSGILGVFLVKKGFDLNTVIDNTTLTAAITAKNLITIKDIEAYWPKASQVTIPGIAGRMERHGRWEYEMSFKHEGVDANLVFWNTVNQNRNFGIAFVTEEYKVFSPLDRQLEAVLAKVSAAPASDQEFGKTRYFEGSIKWKSRDLVQVIDLLTPAIVKPIFQP